MTSPLLASARATAPAAAEARDALAPTGTLRVALFKGSPASFVVGQDGRPAGVTYDLARQMTGATEVSTSGFGDAIVAGMRA